MSWTSHEIIVATMAWDARDQARLVARWQVKQPPLVRALVAGPFQSPVNAFSTWLFLPDGYTQLCEESELVGRARQEFVDLFEGTRYPDGSFRAEWAWLNYGGDEVDEHGIDLRTHLGEHQVDAAAGQAR